MKSLHHNQLPVRCQLQHYLNPLHLYCRLCGWGIPSRIASRMCSRYERLYRMCFQGEPSVGD